MYQLTKHTDKMFSENVAYIVAIVAIVALLLFVLPLCSPNTIPYLGIVITTLSVFSAQLVREEIAERKTNN